MSILKISALIVLIISCSSKKLPYYIDSELKPHTSFNNDHKIADFKFLNQDGDTLTNKFVENQIYVADFFFTTCQGICIEMTDNLLKIQNEFLDKSDLKILSFSVDPKMDTVERLKEYTKEKGIKSKNWQLFTGEKRKLYELASKSFFAGELKFFSEEESFIHSENIYLVDPNKRIRGVYDGTESKEMKRLSKDIKELRKEFPNK